MKQLRNFALAAFAGCISVVLAPTIQADEWNKKTILTVNEAIQMPSCCTPDHTVTLPPGKYVMVLVDSLSDRHIVRVFAEDEKTVITTVLAIPNWRLKPTGKTVLQYWEVPEGQPKELRAWFYPGDNFGQEFAYHKQQALQIATFAKVAVPAFEVETHAVEDLKTVPIVAVEETGKTSEIVMTTPEPQPQPQPEAPVAIAPSEPVQVAVAEAPAVEALPHTASAMPLAALFGILALAAFAILTIRSKNMFIG